MENSQSSFSKGLTIDHLFSLFSKKGYPESSLKKAYSIFYTKGPISRSITLPLVVKEERTFLIADYDPSLRGLSCGERPLLAIARIFFDPPPYFALLTNFRDFILIEVASQKIQKGGSEIIPTYDELLKYNSKETKPYIIDLEEKILGLYLSGG